MGVEEKGRLMAQTPSSWVLFWEDQEGATVGGGEDKHQEKINLEQDSLVCLVVGIITAAVVHLNITTDTTTDTTVGLILEVVDTTVDTTQSTGVSVTTDSHSKTSMEQHMVPVR